MADITCEKVENVITCEIVKRTYEVLFDRQVIYQNVTGITAEKIRVANSAPLNPDIADIYFDTVEDGLFIAA